MSRKDIQRAIDLLNEIHRLDSSVLPALIDYRVPCNDAVAEHPTVQVSPDNKVGLLGIINGIFGTNKNGWGFIAAEFTEPEQGHELKGFRYIEEGWKPKVQKLDIEHVKTMWLSGERSVKREE